MGLTLPFIYVLSLYTVYEGALRGVKWATSVSSSGIVLTVPSTRPLRAPAPTGEAGVLVQAAMAPRKTVAGVRPRKR